MDEKKWEWRLSRERARNAALEKVVEDKTRELYLANESLREQNDSLEDLVEERTADLRVALDHAEAASRAKSDFLAQMSHELRTPLHGLNGTIDALTRTLIDDEQRRLLDLCQTSSARLVRVIGEVLDFSRIESGRMEYDIQPAKVQDMVDVASSSFAAAANQKGIALTVDIDAGQATWVNADSHRIGQALGNLLSNAIKFTDDGGVVLGVRERTLDDGRVELTWTVSDTGCGMTAEASARVFDAFTQAEAGTTREFGGTGLGLAIVKGLVEGMGGTIGVETAIGKGTTFTFTTVHDRACETQAAQVEEGDEVDFTGRKILVVDDHPINRTVCDTMLCDSGCELLFAESGAEAIVMAAEHEPDIILMDCHMPVMSGVVAARTIRSTGYTNPILAVSADVTTDNQAAVLAAGMQGILGKPFRQVELFRAIQQLCAGGELQSGDSDEDALSRPVFAVDSALELVGGQPQLLRKLVNVFLERLSTSLSELTDACRGEEGEAQRAAAHALKGAASVVCAIQMRDICSDLEADGKRGQCTPDRVGELHTIAGETRDALRSYVTD